MSLSELLAINIRSYLLVAAFMGDKSSIDSDKIVVLFIKRMGIIGNGQHHQKEEQ